MKALLIVAFKNYQGKEYRDTRKELEKKGIKVEIASEKLGEAQDKFGRRVKVDKLLSEVNTDEYSAIVFIGGSGAIGYFENKEIQDLTKKAYEADKIIAAICCAPMILKKAGVLKNKKVTVYPDPKWVAEISQENKYVEQNVVVDGNIITASGPGAAEEFGKVIANKL